MRLWHHCAHHHNYVLGRVCFPSATWSLHLIYTLTAVSVTAIFLAMYCTIPACKRFFLVSLVHVVLVNFVIFESILTVCKSRDKVCHSDFTERQFCGSSLFPLLQKAKSSPSSRSEWNIWYAIQDLHKPATKFCTIWPLVILVESSCSSFPDSVRLDANAVWDHVGVERAAAGQPIDMVQRLTRFYREIIVSENKFLRGVTGQIMGNSRLIWTKPLSALCLPAARRMPQRGKTRAAKNCIRIRMRAAGSAIITVLRMPARPNNHPALASVGRTSSVRLGYSHTKKEFSTFPHLAIFVQSEQKW